MDAIYKISSKLFELHEYDLPTRMSIAEYNAALIHAQNEVFTAYSRITHVSPATLMIAEHNMRNDAGLYIHRLGTTLRDHEVSETDIALIIQCISTCIHRMKLSGVTIQ